MTIAAAYLTSDGVVLGADSTSTWTGPKGAQLLNHAQKVFEIGEGTQFGFCVSGAAAVSTITHRTISALLGDWMRGRTDVTCNMLANRLIELCRELTIGADGESIVNETGYASFLLGGIDPGRVPSLFNVEYAAVMENGTRHYVDRVTPLTAKVSYFTGQHEYWHRNFWGYAKGLPDELLSRLRAALLEPTDDPKPLEDVFWKAWNTSIEPYRCNSATDIPLRDAIDYIHSTIHATIKGFKFRQGAPPCGGPVDVAYISTDRNFRWARHKVFDSAVTENETRNEDN